MAEPIGVIPAIKRSYGTTGFLPAAPGSGLRFNPQGDASKGYATYDALTQRYVNSVTGMPHTGQIPGTNNYAINGLFSTTPPPVTQTGQAGNPALPKFDVIKTVKQPEIAGGVTSLTKQALDQQNKTATDLTATLPALNTAITRSYTNAQAANDPTKVEAQLTQNMAGQEAAQRSYAADQGQRNIDYAKETDARIKNLTEQLDTKAAATQATADRSAALGVTASQLPFATNPDTATTQSGVRSSRAISAAMTALLPVTERIAAERYNQTANIEQPLARELFQNDSGLIATKSALEAQFGGNWRSIYQYVQGLKQQAAQMDMANAERFVAQKLQLLGVPAQLLGGNISNLTRLQQLDALANEYTFATPYQPGRLPNVPYYPVTSPSRSYTPSDNTPSPLVGGDGTGGGNAGTTTGTTGPLPPAGTLDGDKARGLPDWAIKQRMQEGWYGSAPTQMSTVPPGSMNRTYGPPNPGAGYTFNADTGPTPLGNYAQTGIVPLRNDFTWGRDAKAQADFLALQRSYQ